MAQFSSLISLLFAGILSLQALLIAGKFDLIELFFSIFVNVLFLSSNIAVSASPAHIAAATLVFTLAAFTMGTEALDFCP